MKFLILLSKDKDNKQNNKINKDRLLFIIYQILKQNKHNELFISDLYTFINNKNNLELLQELKKLSEITESFRIEWIDFNTYFVINIYYE